MLLWNRLCHQWRNLFQAEQWNVGVAHQPIASFVTNGNATSVEWLPTLGKHRFLADPFAMRVGEKSMILAEDFDYSERRGKISFLESEGGDSFSVPRACMDLDTHMSYPYLFEHEGDVYCIPEVHALRQVRLYKATLFPTIR